MPKKFSGFRLPLELHEWLSSHENKSATDLVTDAVKLLSEIDIDIIKGLAKKYNMMPGLIVDISVKYFSKLEENDQLQKIIAYWEERHKESLLKKE